MEKIYLGGKFHFDYMEDGYEEKASKDFRSLILGNKDLLLNNSGKVRLSDNLEYVGPYYFETDGMLDKDIVSAEMEMIENCTAAFFLLEDGTCPGTVSEIIYAATLKKKIRLFYVIDENETESYLKSPCWYPITQCLLIANDLTEVIPCETYEDAINKLISSVKNMY